MKPQKQGQIVKFSTNYPGEDPDQRYVILEIHFDVEKPRALIRELNGGKPFASSTTVFADELEVVEVDTTKLNGHEVTINKGGYSLVKGTVIEVREQKIIPDLSLSHHGIETNIWLTIEDNNGKAHTGTLFVN